MRIKCFSTVFQGNSRLHLQADRQVFTVRPAGHCHLHHVPGCAPGPFRLLEMALNQRARILPASLDDLRLERGCLDR